MPTSLGPAEIMVILVVALIVLGPKRLPEAGRQVGKAIAEVRKWSQGFQNEIRTVMDPEDTSRLSYSQPQPGYDPAPLPMMPAETSPPGPSAPEAAANGTTGSHGEVDESSPADWTPWDRPAPGAVPAPAAETAPPEAPGPPAGEAPSS